LVAYPVLLQDKDVANRQLFDIACNVEGVEILPRLTSRYVAALYRFARIMPLAIMPSRYVAVAKRLDGYGLIAEAFENPLLTQRRLQVLTLAGAHLDELDAIFHAWIIGELKQTATR
jgi:hypothetical protein